MNKLMLAATCCAVFVSIAMGEATDEQLRAILHRATQYIDDPRGGPGEVRHAIGLSGNDTNRIVSLLKQMIDEGTGDDGATMFYLSEIGKHGTHLDLPFLCQRVATTNYCEDATAAILNIEGLTTNSLLQIKTSLPQGGDVWGVMCSWGRILEAARDMQAGATMRALTVSNAVSYASQLTSYVNVFDGCIIRADPTYRASKRRLAVMRSVRDLGVNEWHTNFVTQTIRELEAYPEANLPE